MPDDKTTVKKVTKKKTAKKTTKKKTAKKVIKKIKEACQPDATVLQAETNRKPEDFSINRPMSASSASRILQDIELWKYEKENPKPDSKATAYGSALHCLLLEPKNFSKKFIIATDAPRNKNGKVYGRTSQAFQNWLALAQQAAGKKKIITDDEYNEILPMQKAYKPIIDNLIKLPGRKLNCERKVEWTDEETKHPCVGYIDAEIAGIVLDIKTTSDMTEDKLYRKCQDSYFIQAAVYADALKVIDKAKTPLVYFVFLRSQPPYSHIIVQVEKEALELGLKEFRKAINKYRECAEKKSFKIRREPTKWSYKPWKIREINGD